MMIIIVIIIIIITVFSSGELGVEQTIKQSSPSWIYCLTADSEVVVVFFL